MVSITTQTSSIYALKFKEIHADTKVRERSRRVSRIATLDGSSVITDSGYTDTDRTLTIKAKLTLAQTEMLEYMIENYSLWNVVANDGYYSCAPQRLVTDNGETTITLLIGE
jgi:3-keto-L-gulonate-6-phosphate decarboxylase